MGEKLYLDVIPKIRVYEKKLFDNVKYNRMIELENEQEVFKFLSESSYSENISQEITISNYEKVFSAEFQNLFKNLKNVFDDESLINIFLKKYVYNNLKLMIKAKFLNIDLGDVLFEIDGFDNEHVFSSIKNDDFKALPNEISKLVSLVCKDFEEHKNPQNIDVIIDKEMFERLIEDAKKIGDNFLIRYIENLIDVFNVKTLFRAKNLNLDKKFFDKVIAYGGNIPVGRLKSMFVEPRESLINDFSTFTIYKYIKEGIDVYSNNGTLSVLDKQLDDYTMDFLKSAKIITTGLAPIIGYINAKENEIKNMRIILVGKINKVDSDSIKRRLRENYV